MNLAELLNQSFATFRAHKMRIFLTMFGIVWGIASVILLVGLGRGFSVDQKRRLQTLGKDLVIVWGGRTSAQVGGRAAGREINLTIDDAHLIRDECYLVKNVSPELRRTIPEVSQFNSASRGVVGMWPSYQDFRSLLLEEGRLITDDDERESRRVVILGSAARQQLFPGQPAVGAAILIKSLPYTVVGTLKKKDQNSNYSGPDNDYLFAPYSSVARDFPPPEKPGITRGWLENIVFEVAQPEEHDAAVEQVRRVLGRVHHFDAKDKDALFIWDTMEGAKILDKIFGVVTFFFGCVAVTTLCLGGIGVMNIMLRVSYRTYSRDWRTQGARSNEPRHSAPVLCRVCVIDCRQRNSRVDSGSGHLSWHLESSAARFRSSPDCFAYLDCRFNRNFIFDHANRRDVSRPARSGNATCGVASL